MFLYTLPSTPVLQRLHVPLLPILSVDRVEVTRLTKDGTTPLIDESPGNISVGSQLLRVLEEIHDGLTDAARFQLVSVRVWQLPE